MTQTEIRDAAVAAAEEAIRRARELQEPTSGEASPPTVADRLAFAVDDAAYRVGVSRSQLYREMAAGRLRFRQLGGRRLIAAHDLEAWLASLPTGPDAA